MDNKHPYVGYVVKRYPRFSETFIVNEILAHERAGMKLDIFALGDVQEAFFQESISRVKAPVTRFNSRQYNAEYYHDLLRRSFPLLPELSGCFSDPGYNHVHEFAQAVMLAATVQERGIRHLHAHFATKATTVARLAAKLAGITYSFTAHAKDIYFDYPEDSAISLKLRDASRVITVSDYNCAWLQKKYGGNLASLERLYNGIDLQQYLCRDNLIGPENTEILAVGRLVVKKGFSTLIEALRLLYCRGMNFHCTLVGDGPLKETLRRQVEESGLSSVITLTGAQPQGYVKMVMHRATMLVAPCIISSDGDRDGLPTVLLEAMAQGLPVISTRVAGIPELVTDGHTGFCIDPEKPGVMADAIERMAGDAVLRKYLALNARKRIEDAFDIDRNTRRLREIFEDAIQAGIQERVQ